MDIIKVENLTKKFREMIAVDNISFSVKEGEIFAFLGPNGAGKSTTIKMLTTLLKPDSGSIVLNGYNSQDEEYEVRKSFGIVFQDPSLDDELTAFENMNFHAVLYKVQKEKRKERIKELLEMVELWERRDDFIKNFSGGMKRRLEIARGLLHHPKVLFLDEPTIGLDPQTRNHIWNYILDLNKKEKITVFFTTHYMDEAEKIANCIAIIDHGRIIKSGSVEELKKFTGKNSLEDAFLELTGKIIREEKGNGLDKMRMGRKMWKR
ncbi:MAG: ATP-binding cassette domain-containing protein [bacterium]